MSIEEVKLQIKNIFIDLIKADDVDHANFEKFNNAKGTENSLAHLSRFIVSFYLRNLIEGTIINLNKFIRRCNITSDKNWIELYPRIKFRICEDKHLGMIEIDGYTRYIDEIINFPEEFINADIVFHEYLKDKIHNSFMVQRMDGIGSMIVKKLFKAYLNNPQQLPDKTIYTLYKKYNQRFIDEKWDKYRPLEPRDDEIFTRIVSDLRKHLKNDRHDDKFKPHLFRTICDYISGMTDKYAAKEYHELYGLSALF